MKLTIIALGLMVAAAGFATETITLKSACRKAVENHPVMKSAQATADVASAQARKAKSALSPSLTLKSVYSALDEPTTFGDTPIVKKETIINRVELVQPIFTGGGLQHAANAANWNAMAVKSMSGAVKSSVVLNASSAYFNAKMANEFIKIAESAVRSLTANRDTVQKLFDEGAATRSDLLRAEVALNSAVEQSIKAQNSYLTTVAALKQAMGLPQSMDITLADNNEDFGEPDKLQPSQRFELQAAEYFVKAAQAQVKAVKSAELPSLMLMLDFENQPEGSEFPRHSNTFGLALIAQWKIFDGGQTKSAVSEAKSNLAKAGFEYENIKISVEFQIESAKLALKSASARLQALETQVQSAEESLRIMKIGYEEGINTLTDVLSAEAALTSAQSSLATAKYDKNIAQVNLLLALGITDSLLN